MDGNGRWAQRKGFPRVYGHIRGCNRARDVIRAAQRLGVRALTLFTFSSENWGRPSDEVEILMRLLRKWIIRRTQELLENEIQVRAIGNVERLPSYALKVVRQIEDLSKNNRGMVLTIALSYGGREEILATTKQLIEKVKNHELHVDDINEKLFSSMLPSADLGDPDLLIRTSGEQRISNFLLWQMAYTELYFTDRLWPDFSEQDFHQAVAAYSQRERRFGLTSNQAQLL